MKNEKLELKSVYELSPDEMQELDLQEGEEFSLFEYVENHELFNYLDGFDFVGEFEVINAIEDFFKGGEGTSRGELSEYQKLAKEWMELRNVKFDLIACAL